MTEQQEVKRAVAEVHRLTATMRKHLQSSGLSPQGVDYIIQTVDPFHDEAISVVGAPDPVRAKSLVYDIRQDVTLTKPASVTGLWDCHVAFLPFIESWDDVSVKASIQAQAGRKYFQNLKVQTSGDNTSFIQNHFPAGGPVFVNSVQSGVPTFDATASSASDQWQHIDMLGGASGGIPITPRDSLRLIGGAFEIRNTTAEIYKQGSQVGYRNKTTWCDYDLNSEWSDSGGVDVPLTNVPTLHCTVVSGPPCTVSQAKQIGGITLSAAEGSLVPLTLDFDDNEPTKYSARHLFITSEADTSTEDTVVPCFGNSGSCLKPVAYTALDLYDLPSSGTRGAGVLGLPFSQSGVIFTGLSEQTVLTLTSRFYVEVFPATNNELYTLARQSPAYDPKVGPVIAALMSDLLPVYPVGMNAKGDFFRLITQGLGKAVKFATPLVINSLDNMPDPRAKAAAQGIRAVENLVTAFEKKKKEKSQVKKGK